MLEWASNVASKQCKQICSDSCSQTVTTAQEIKNEYERVCLGLEEPNYNFYHYCGFQCTKVCRIQTQVIMEEAISSFENNCN